MGNITGTVTNPNGSPAVTAAVHIDWSQLGITAGSYNGFTDASGKIAISMPWTLVGADGAGAAQLGLNYATFSVHADSFGNGSFTVMLQPNASASLGADVANIAALAIPIFVIVAIVIVAVVVIKWVLPKKWSNPFRSKDKSRAPY
jgi:hypothetical protein